MKWCVWCSLFCTLSRLSILPCVCVRSNIRWDKFSSCNKNHVTSNISSSAVLKRAGKALALLLPSFTGWCGWHQDCLQSEILKCSFAGWVSEEFERVLEIGHVYLCQSSECDASSLLMCLWSFACNIRKVRVPFSVLFSCPGMSSWVFSLLLTSDHVLNCQHVLVSNIVS